VITPRADFNNQRECAVTIPNPGPRGKEIPTTPVQGQRYLNLYFNDTRALTLAPSHEELLLLQGELEALNEGV